MYKNNPIDEDADPIDEDDLCDGFDPYYNAFFVELPENELGGQ